MPKSQKELVARTLSNGRVLQLIKGTSGTGVLQIYDVVLSVNEGQMVQVRLDAETADALVRLLEIGFHENYFT